MADLLRFPAPAQLPFVWPASPDLPEPPLASLPDAEARHAALDIRRSWIVEAPAGSGKTGLLIQRLLKLLAFADVERPADVLAITFTRKAAGELRGRVLQQLQQAAQQIPLEPGHGDYERATRALALAVLDRDRAAGWHLLSNPQILNIRTIDSFCGELAGSVPLLSRGAGPRQPTEQAGPLYELAAERTLRKLGGDDPVLDDALQCVLLHRDAQIADCIRLIASMLAEREQWGEFIPLRQEQPTEEFLDTHIRTRLERTLETVLCRALSAAAEALGPDLLADLTHLASRLGVQPGYRGGSSPLAFCGGLTQPPPPAANALPHWLALVHLLFTGSGSWRVRFSPSDLGFELSSADVTSLRDLVEQLKSRENLHPGIGEILFALRSLPPARYPDDQWRVAKALFRVLRDALAELQLIFAEQNTSDFTEVALTARELLRSEPDLLDTSAARLSHLLIDEMQDTSTLQYELLETLTRGWDGSTQTLFLVGDPKQSIYAFRQARVERFLRTETTGRFGDVPLGTLRLTANFRSQADLVASFNDTFAQILPSLEQLRQAPGETAEVPFAAATATRGPGGPSPLQWHGRVVPRRYLPPPELSFDEPIDPPDPTADEEALAIRQTIEDFTARWQQRPLEPGQAPKPPRMVVLARSRAHLAPVIAEFHRDRGHGELPFRAVEIELLNERPEILDLLALTRALLHPGDRIAWLAVLHSPVCGLGLADLLALTGEGPDADPQATVLHLVETRTHLLSPKGQALLGRTWPVLSAAHANLGRTAFSTHIERTWRSLGADAALRPNQRENARRFLALLAELEAGPESLSLALLERRIGRLYAEPVAAPGAVELMTIHRAKGLEWDLVLIPALHRSTANNQHGLLRWLELDGEPRDEAQVLLAPIHGKGEEASTLSKWLRVAQAAREAAEAKRLFYVACTRAREELHLFCAASYNKDGQLSDPTPGSLLAAAWPAAGRVLADQFASRTLSTPVPIRSERLPLEPEHLAQPLTLSLAASADVLSPETPPEAPYLPRLTRLPESFDPLARFRPENGPQLPYPPASALRNAAPFTRPEGSFAARAFGNIVHRFLELLADRLAGGQSAADLLAEMPRWQDRVVNVFRAEGLAPVIGAREAERVLRALTLTLQDSMGRWLLSPHTGARSERALQGGASEAEESGSATLRADRLFFAGPDPLSTALNSHLWIVDFKTAEPGGRELRAFLAAEKQKYEPQMRAYARACTAATTPAPPIVLALYYPLITQMLHWDYLP